MSVDSAGTSLPRLGGKTAATPTNLNQTITIIEATQLLITSNIPLRDPTENIINLTALVFISNGSLVA